MLSRIHTATIGSLLTALVFWCAFCTADEPKKEGDKDKPLVVASHIRLWEEYGKNEAAADLKYTDKVVEVSFVDGPVEKNAKGIYFINVQSVGPRDPKLSANGYYFVNESSIKKIATAKEGQAFAVRGVCKGRKTDKSAFQGYSISLEDCEVLYLLTWDGKKWKKEE